MKPKTILIVEDDVSILEVEKLVFEMLGYKVLTATSGKEGFRLYKEHKDEVNLILTDITMPEMDGIKMYEEIKKINPNVKIVFTSGYFDGNIPDQKPFILKPLNLDKLSKVVEEEILKEKICV